MPARAVGPSASARTPATAAKCRSAPTSGAHRPPPARRRPWIKAAYGQATRRTRSAPRGRLPDAKELEELPKALTIEAVRQAEPGAIRRVVLDAQTRATAFMALLGTNSLAQKLYWHYLDGSGADIWFTRDEVRRLRPLAEAEKQVERAFAATTLSGKTEDGKVASFLGSLTSGEAVVLPRPREIPIAGTNLPVFDHNVGTRYGLTAAQDALSSPGAYLAVGQTSVTGGVIGGTARRHGSAIHLEATVRFGLNDPFNFRQGQPGGWEGVMLERYAGARSFDMRAQWDRKLVATIEIGRDRNGKAVFTPKQVTWRDVD